MDEQSPLVKEEDSPAEGQTRRFAETPVKNGLKTMKTHFDSSTPAPSVVNNNTTHTDKVNISPVVGGTGSEREGGQTDWSACVHDSKGICSIHDGGAKQKLKPDGKIKYLVADGKTRYKMKRLIYFECDIAPGRGGCLRRTKMSFMKTTCPGASVESKIDISTI